MLVTLQNNTGFIGLNGRDYNSVYIGDTLVWSNTPLIHHNFIKYYYGNIDRMFDNNFELADHNAVSDQFLMKSFINDTSPKYELALSKAYSDFTNIMINHIVTGINDQLLVSNYIDYTTIVDSSAVSDQFLTKAFQNDISPKYELVTAKSINDFSNIFLTKVILGVSDQLLIHNFGLNIPQGEPSAVSDQFLIKEFINDISPKYDLINAKSYNDFSNIMINYIVSGIVDQSLTQTYVDYSTIVDATAVSDQFLLTDYINNISPVYATILANSYNDMSTAFKYNVTGIYDQMLTFAQPNIPTKFVA